MFRPCINKKTWAVDLINLDNNPDLSDYDIVKISREANEWSINLDWDEVKTESKDKQAGQKLSELEEDLQIEKALWKK